jgi:predicted TIM-barrel fold metal-dependent hydrolase
LNLGALNQLIDVAALPKISADAHVNEPHDLWYKRLPEDLREASPHRIQTQDDGGWRLVVNGEVDESGSQIVTGDVGQETTAAQRAALEAAEEDKRREAEASVDVRLAMMHTDGIHGEMVYPTIGLYVYGVDRPDVGIASCRVYNDWISDRLGGDCPRIRYAALIPAWDVASAITEVQRAAEMPGVGALMLPLVGTPTWNLPHWEPLWSAIAETKLPVVMHQGTGHSMIFFRGWGSPTANLLATQSMASWTASLLSCGGVLERHPDLHFVLVEVNAGWMAWTMSTLDEYFIAHKAALRKPHLPELPSHYLRRQVHATFQRDPIAIAARQFTGVNCLMWGNDFPHDEGTFPDSQKVLEDLLDGVPVEEAAQISGGNAMDIFRFDRSVLDSLP